MTGKEAKPVKDPFRHISAQEASRLKEKKPALNARREASSVYINFLHLDATQAKAVQELHDHRMYEEHIFGTDGEEQVKAAAYMSSHQLDLSARELISNRWSIKWSKRTGKGAKANATQRVLYQCDCGSSEEAMKSKTRRIPLPFTACLVHAEVTYDVNTTNILRIATEDMRNAAWEVAHRCQAIMDGTFGLCDAKLLLFIMMGIDLKNRGVPLAFLFFSAPSENKTTSSGYDHIILQKLLQEWKDALGKRNGSDFSPAVIITDTDAKERRAGALVFPETEFILCHFHVRQSWKNHRVKVLRGDSQIHKDFREQLRAVETYLLESEDYTAAKAFVTQKVADFEAITEYPDIAAQGLLHLQYFLSYWLASEGLWLGFSRKGRILAAKRVGCPVDLIVTTTNHLESFNGVLKGKYVQNWKRGGRRLRVDMLLFVMVTSIGPAIFRKRQIEDEAEKISESKLRSLPGGELLIEKRREQMTKIRWRGKKGAYHSTSGRQRRLFFAEDAGRDAAALEILQHKQISAPDIRKENDGFTFTCYSTKALENDANPTVYDLHLLLDGTGGCSCPDFQNKGGACKHLRAALIVLNEARKSAPSIPIIPFPSNEDEANALAFASESSTPTFDATQPQEVQIVDIELRDPLERALETVRDAFTSTDDVCLTVDGLDCNDSLEDDRGIVEEDSPSPRSCDASSDIDEDDTAEMQLIPATNTRQAIDDQSLLRVLTDLEHDAPKQALHFSLLDGIQMGAQFQERVERAQTSMSRYVALFDELRTRMGGTTSKATDTTITTKRTHTTLQGPCAQPLNAQRPQSPISEHCQSNKRSAEDILPPSPEKTSSKRHQSYSIH